MGPKGYVVFFVEARKTEQLVAQGRAARDGRHGYYELSNQWIIIDIDVFILPSPFATFNPLPSLHFLTIFQDS